METIAEYRTGVLTVLGDSGGRRYTEAQLDMALRQALSQLDSQVPGREAVKVRIARMNGTEAVLNWLPPDGADILAVKGENGMWYNAADHRVGPNTFIQFYGKPLPAGGQQLMLELSRGHTIRGLDNGTETTVPAPLGLAVCTGAAGYALRIRASSVAEVFGKRPEDTQRLQEQSDRLLTEYADLLSRAAMHRAFHRDPWPRKGFPI